MDPTLATRASLLGRLKNWNDQQSWQEFFDRYWKLIYHVALRGGLNHTEAQDVVQETIIGVAKNIEGFSYDPAVCSFKTWMLRATRWSILKQFRRRERERRPSEPIEGSADPQMFIENIPDPTSVNWDGVWEEEWKKFIYEAAIHQVKKIVSSEQFQIFDLHVTEQCPAREVARTLKVSLANVYVIKHRVSRLIEKAVRKLEAGEEQGINHSMNI